MSRHFAVTFILILLASLAWTGTASAAQSEAKPKPAAKGAQPGLPAPSANQGRAGMYSAGTSKPQYNYWVYVPKSYSADHPAGLHLFFHGNGGQSMAQSSFSMWAPVFLEPLDLIGINMEYNDGTPHVDAENKAAAAHEAVLQVMADYRIVAGRGVLAAFSAGGSPAGIYFATHGAQAKERGPDWPFSHVTVYGSCLRTDSEIAPLPTSWCRACGDGEEAMAPGLLAYMVGKTWADLKEVPKGGCAEVFLNFTRGRGHTILPEDEERSAACFRRSDLAIAPFLYEPDYPEAALAPLVKKANSGRLGEAAVALEKLDGDGKADAAVRRKASAVHALIDRRVEQQAALCKELIDTDPVLALYYGEVFGKPLQGHPGQKAIEGILAPVQKTAKKWRGIRDQWIENFGKIFEPTGCQVRPEMVSFLEDMKKTAGEKSQIGMMATKFLDFAPAPAPAAGAGAKGPAKR